MRAACTLECSTVENQLFHSPWRWWLSLSEQLHATVIEFTSEIQIYEWSSFRKKSAGIKHRLGVKAQSKRSKSHMALKFSKVLRKSVFSPSPFQMGAMVLWCAWLFWGNSIWAWIRTGMAHMCWLWWSCWCKQIFSPGICRQNFDFFSNQPHTHHTRLWARYEIAPLLSCL